jgi:phospholipid-binding lipoprotein MlaA
MFPALRSLLLLLVGMVGCGIAGCATPPPPSDTEALSDYRETNDPLEPTNRIFYAINNGMDTVIFRPAAQAYVAVVPEKLRTGIHNLLANLGTPVVLANDILQTKSVRAGDTLMRMLINTTIGVGGIFDVATGWGWPAHDTDFGITLGLWGVPDGPFLFLPILGPSDPRDATGFGVDIAMDPLTWVGKGAAVTALGYSRYALSAVDQRASVLGQVDQIKKTALDPYATFRSLYRQYRASELQQTRDDNRVTVPDWYPAPLPQTGQ